MVLLDNPDSGPAITVLAEARALLRERRVCAVVWRGERAFAKRGHHLRWHERLLLSLAPQLSGWLAPGVPFEPRRRGPMATSFEARRLLELRHAGCRVPRLLASDHDLLVTAYAGESLERRLAREPLQRGAWGSRAGAELAALHAIGEWHGGAQVRNLLVDEQGRLVRIDFDTALDDYFPLPVLQAIDALLLLSSLSAWPDALDAAAAAYLDHASRPTRSVLARCRPRLLRLAHWRLLQQLAPKEGRRLSALAGPLSRL